MAQKNRFTADHHDFGTFISREIHQLSIECESFRSACHMKQNYVNDIKRGSITTR